MRKNLLTLGSLALSISLSSQVLTYVGSDAQMTVKDGTLVYSGGGWQNDKKGKVENFGDIMVVSDSNAEFTIANATSEGATDAGEFTLKYTGANTYGQLYINGLAQDNIKGKVTKEYTADVNHGSDDGSGRQQVGLPFYGLSVDELKSPIFFDYLQITSSALNSQGRFNKASAFRWNNKKIRFDQLLTGQQVGKATDYFIIPRTNSAGTVEWNPADDLKKFIGVPYADKHGTDDFTLEVLDTTYVSDLGAGGIKKNYYNETYKSYINDPFVDGTVAGNWQSGGNYGKNLSQFANPFLTNLDLTNLKVIGGSPLANIRGIAYYNEGSVSWDAQNGSTYTENKITLVKIEGGSLQLGDVDDPFVIKPMGEVMVKLSGAANINLNDARSFSQTKRSNDNYDVASRSSSIPSDKIVKQLGVTLLNADGEQIGRTFYAVSPSATTGREGASLQAFVGDYPIYTKEEKEDGGEDTDFASHLYINEANETSFKGKEIPMFINYSSPASIRFDVFEAGVKLTENQTLTSGDFYIKDGNDIIKIKSGDTMVVGSDYYGLYYEQPEGTLGTNTALLGNTIIAKNVSDWVVRFSKNWKTANIEVYTAAGQLIHSKKNVSTSQDYIIPLNSQANGMFIVRAISDSGEAVTKKIVK